MTRNSVGAVITFIYARIGLTDAGVGRPFGLGRFNRKPSVGLHNSISFEIALSQGGHSRLDCALRNIHCSLGSDANVASSRIVLLVLNATATRALL